MINFNKPHLTGKEAHYMYQAVFNCKLSGNGDFTKKCQSFFEQRYGYKKAILTTSGSDALEMAAILCNINPGDEVIVPSYTFVSSALAFVRERAKIVFADSCANNPNIDPDKLEELITPKTKAIVVVHYAGIACDMENALRMDAACVAVQTFIGAPGESRSLELLCRTADAGTRCGIPTLGVVAVGKQMERTEKFFQLATRVLAENGANLVKSYYCDGFERVAAACPVPIVIAGGKKLPELEALEMAYKAIQEGAHGVDMGRNIFQSDCPAGMAQAIGKVVHGGYTAQQAFEVYQEIKNA